MGFFSSILTENIYYVLYHINLLTSPHTEAMVLLVICPFTKCKNIFTVKWKQPSQVTESRG